MRTLLSLTVEPADSNTFAPKFEDVEVPDEQIAEELNRLREGLGSLNPVDRAAASKMSGDITVGVRPEAWRMVTEAEGGLPVKVAVVEELGADAFLYGTSDVEGTPNEVVVRMEARRDVQKGSTVEVMAVRTGPSTATTRRARD